MLSELVRTRELVKTTLYLLHRLPGCDLALRVSLYADDAIIFINPRREEVDSLLHILSDFDAATGLYINPAKSTVSLIRCENINVEEVLQGFAGAIAPFPSNT